MWNFGSNLKLNTGAEAFRKSGGDVTKVVRGGTILSYYCRLYYVLHTLQK